MKKISQTIILILGIIILSGCGWDDIVKDYADIIPDENEENLTCKYVPERNSEPLQGLEYLEFSANKQKLQATYLIDNIEYTDTLGEGGDINNTSYVGGNDYSYANFDLEEFLEYYKEYGTFMSQIYLCSGSDFTKISTTKLDQNGLCNVYVLDDSTKIPSPTSPENNTYDENNCLVNTDKCINNNAVYCKQDVMNNYNNQKIIIERGITESNAKYVWIYPNGNTKGTKLILDSQNNFFDTDSQNNYSYLIEDTEIDAMFTKVNCEYPNIYLSTEYMGASVYNYITIENHEGRGNYNGTISNNYDAAIEYQSSDLSEGDPSKVVLPDSVEGMNLCSENGVKQVLHILGIIIFIAKLVVPLILIVLGTLDLVSALKDPDDKSMKDQVTKLVKRIILAIMIFLIPTIINLVFSLIDNAIDLQGDFSGCTECIFKPFNGNCNYTRMGE